MLNRDDIIKIANDYEVEAEKRDWSMGQTVLLKDEPQYVEVLKGNMYRRAIYLVREEKGWLAEHSVDLFVSRHMSDEELPSFLRAWCLKENLEQFKDMSETTAQKIQDRQKSMDSAIHYLENKQLQISWETPHPIAGKHAFRTEEELKIEWLNQGGKLDKLPVIDFTKYMVIAIFNNEGSYQSFPAIQSIHLESHSIIVTYGRYERMWSMINPCSIKIIDLSNLPVEFTQQS